MSLSEHVYNGQIFSKTAESVWNELKETYDKVDASFLMGLDDVYTPIRSQILTSDLVPSVKVVFLIIARDESHRMHSNQTQNSKIQSTAFVSKTGFYNSNNSGNNRRKYRNPPLKCTKCNMLGHTVDRCYELIGYPPGYIKKPFNQGTPRFNSNNSGVDKCASVESSMQLTNEQIMKLLSLVNDKENAKSIDSNVAGNFMNNNVFFNKNFNEFYSSNCFQSSQNTSKGWIIDSGANQHTVSTSQKLNNVVDITDLNLSVNHPNGTVAKFLQIGNLKLSNDIELFDVLVIPQYCDLTQKRLMGTGSESDGLYFFDEINSGKQFVSNFTSAKSKHNIWHCRLGHPADQVLQILGNSLGIENVKTHEPCDVCHKAKQTRDPFPLSEHKSKHVDDYSIAVWTYLLKSKTEVADYFESFYNLMLNQFEKRIKVIRSDNGTEFINNKMNCFITNKGIIHQTSYAFTPQQNGIAERKHRHLLNVARSLMFQGEIPLYLWSECILTATYLINRLSSSVFSGKCPYELVYGCKPAITPLESGVIFSSLDDHDSSDQPLENISEYQKLVRKLIYITLTRPDIAYVVHCLSQFMHAPLKSHLKAAFRVLRYLKGCPGKSVTIRRNNNFIVTAFVDSDFAKGSMLRKSVTGFCVFMGNNLISWKSKKQSTVSRSSAEAEYRALASVTCEVIWILKVLTDLKVNTILPIKIFCDNKSDLQIAKKKKIGVIETSLIRSNENLSDIFTKGLSGTQHNLLRERLTLFNLFS
ncbi:uncharacterized protein [Rutidosis leptorrhynchoides]|uniref:uncharacterized protein n=1 Tax=Rutidosis leptorrhynchoides TaxID=125765 RepID=UPI003A99CC70